MTLPYESATSGEKAIGEIQRILGRFGCQQFGTMVDEELGEVRVMCSWNRRQIIVPASWKGYAAAWLKEHPWSHRMRCNRVAHERKALEVARVAVYSMLRDWIKGQVTAVEVGILSFEGAFLGQIMLPSGLSVLDHVKQANVLQLEHKS